VEAEHRRPPRAAHSHRQQPPGRHLWALLGTLTDEERNDPQWDPDNRHAWSAFFAWQRGDRHAVYDGSGPSPKNFNSEGRRRWWSAPGRILTWVLDHIAMPPPP
jgi:hypothetical protein